MATTAFRNQSARYFQRPHSGTPTALVRSPAAWRGADLRDREDLWLEHWTAEEIEALESAGIALVNDGASLDEVSATNFKIPAAAARLQRAARQVSEGRGFVMLRGLPVERWGEALTSMI